MRPILLVLVAMFLGGCATAYQSSGFTGGFSETQFAPHIYEVNFRGNAYTRSERLGDFAMLPAAELCLANGFRYFIVASSQDTTRLSTYTTPQTASTNATTNVYGNTAYTNTSTTYTGGQTQIITKPGESMVVGFFNEQVEGFGFVYDAEFLNNSIRTKYGIEPLGAEQ